MKLVHAIIPVLLLPVITFADDLKIEYFKDASLSCDLEAHNFSLADIKERYWLLPDGRLVGPSVSDARIHIDADYRLNITKIDDIDFGRYSCLLIFTNYTMTSIQHSLNIDGPYFGDLLSKYRKNAIIGGVAAGSLFLVLASGCLFWNFRYHRRSRKNKAVDALDKAIDGYDLKTYDNVGLETETAITKFNNDETAQM